MAQLKEVAPARVLQRSRASERGGRAQVGIAAAPWQSWGLIWS